MKSVPFFMRCETTTRATRAPLLLQTSTHVVIGEAAALCIGFRNPYNWAAAVKGQHQKVIRIGQVNHPFLMRSDEVQHQMRLSVNTVPDGRYHSPGITMGRAVDTRRLRQRRASTDDS